MKSLVKKIAVLLAVALFVSTICAGCHRDSATRDGKIVVFTINGQDVYLNEVKLYAYEIEYASEESYGSLLVTYFGSVDDYWNGIYDSDSGSTYWTSALAEAASALFQTKELNLYAQENGISLTDEEKAKVEEQVASFLKTREVIIKQSNADEALVRKYVEENAIANKAYLDIIADIDTEIDEEEYLRKEAEMIIVTPATTKPLPEDAAEGTEAEAYTDEEIAATRTKVLADVFAQMKAGVALTDIVSAYAEDDTVTVAQRASVVVSKTMAETGTYAYYEALWNMAEGEYKSAELDNSTGLEAGYAMHMLDEDDEEEKQSAIESELDSRKSTLFTEVIKEYNEKVEYLVHEDALGSIAYQGTVYPVEVETTAAETTTAEATTAEAK